MCGILGVLGRYDRKDVEAALHRLRHRGPDGQGVWADPGEAAILGHRRLAIIDIGPSGHQPMVDAELVITYNGEIYNYLELKKLLQDKGHVFKTSSDTEVILKSYREWGADCLNMFNGMWAFGIWNRLEKRLFLARDRFGVKPMFYHTSPSVFAFASEMKGLTPFLEKIGLGKDFHWCVASPYAYEGTDKTLVDGIIRFPAGHYAIVDMYGGKMKLSRFWNTLDYLQTVDTDYEAQVNEFRNLFIDAVKIRLRADVKVGITLSGGIDSSSIAAAVGALTDGPTNTAGSDYKHAFIATFDGTELDETRFANDVVEALKLKAYFPKIDPSAGLEKLFEYLWYFEEIYPTSPIPMVELYQAIKANDVNVSLDGHGGDELLAGYGNALFEIVKETPLNIANLRTVISTYKGMRALESSTWRTLVDGFSGRKNLLKFYISFLSGQIKEDDLAKKLGLFNAELYREFHFTILPTLLRNYDRYSMTASVESRMPFMDYRLVKFCFSLPWTSKIMHGRSKAILRDAMRARLPSSIYNRKLKIGFGTPFTSWLKGPWKEHLLDMASSSRFRNSETIDSGVVVRQIENFYASPNPSVGQGRQVWQSISPFLWQEAFLSKV